MEYEGDRLIFATWFSVGVCGVTSGHLPVTGRDGVPPLGVQPLGVRLLADAAARVVAAREKSARVEPAPQSEDA